VPSLFFHRQEGFEAGFERGVEASEDLGFWLGVVVVIQKLSEDGKLSVDVGDKHQLDLFKLSLKSYVEVQHIPNEHDPLSVRKPEEKIAFLLIYNLRTEAAP